MVDRRAAIDAALNVVDAVAVVAGGGHHQAHLQQGAAVDAVQVLGRHLGIAHAVFGGDPLVAVALAAGPGEVELEDRRGVVGHRHDVVGTVAVVAGGGGGGAHGVADAVDAGGVDPGDLRMAGGAVNWSELLRMRNLLDIGVTIGAGELPVDRFFELLGVDGEGDFPAAHLPGQRPVRVAAEAGGVGDGGRAGIPAGSQDQADRQDEQCGGASTVPPRGGSSASCCG